ncbi:MAG: cytochrome c-type biogenesis protein [Hyphomicrobium sp.]
MRWVLVVLAVALMPAAALAVQPDEIMPNAADESRARAISHGLRCLVCQNQSIDDSDAPLARDLRLLVRERIKAGDSDTAVIDYVVARYGDFVLLKPPLKPATLVLWLSPIVLLLAGIWLGRKVMRGPGAGGERVAPLTDAERDRLKQILGDTPNA